MSRPRKPCCSSRLPHSRGSCAIAASAERLVAGGQAAIDAFNAARPGSLPHMTGGVHMRRIVAVLADIARGIDGIEQRSRMYAVHPEALESQFLQLVAMRQHLIGRDDFDLHDAYERFVAELIGERSNTYLHVILREHGVLDKLPGLLGDFGRWVAREWPAEVARC